MKNTQEELEKQVKEGTEELDKTIKLLELERRRFHDVLDVLPVYVILLTPDYRVPLENRFFRERFGESHGKRCYEYLFGRTEPCEVCETFKVLNTSSPVEWNWRGPDGHDYYIYDFPFKDVDGSPLILEMGLDITDRKHTEQELGQYRDQLEEIVNHRTALLESTNAKLQEEIAARVKSQNELYRLNRTLRALGKINRILTTSDTEQDFLDQACRIIVEDCGHKMVWIGYARDDENKSVEPVSHFGFEEGYLNRLNISWADVDRGRGPTGTTIRTGQPTLCVNMLTDPAFEPWRKDAINRGYRSSAVFPLILDSRTIGAINIYSTETDPFSENEIKLLQELSENLSSGINYLQMKKAHEISEQTLFMERNNLQQIFDTANVGMFLLDSDGTINRVNNMLSHWLKRELKMIPGVQPGEGIGCIHASEDPRGCGYSVHCPACPIRNTFESVLDAWEPVHGIEADISILVDHEPAHLWVDLSADPVIIDEQKHVILVMNNITDRKKAETALDLTEKRYRELVEKSPVAIFINRDDRLVYVNPAAIRLFGASRQEDLLGRSPFELLHTEYHPLLKKRLETILSGSPVPTVEARIVRLDGTFRIAEITAVAFRDTEGTAIQVILHDITDRKTMEESIREMNAELELRVHERTVELENAVKEQELFTYSISHDLRAPLRHISGYLGLINKKSTTTLDETTKKYMSEVSDAAVRMGVLIDSILSFSRLSRTPMKKSKVDLSKLVQDVRKIFNEEIKSRKITWIINPLPAVWGDPDMLTIVITNLLGNSIKFTRNKPSATIEIGCLKENKKEFVFYVRDNGAGFDIKYVDKLFKLFERLHDNREFEGTGIGLANVKRIIQRHGGRTWAEGEPGKGAAIYFSLPRN